jgi:hypothetical protein
MSDIQQAAIEYLTAGLRILALTGKKPNGRVHGENWSWNDSFNGVPLTITEANAVKDAFSEEMGTTGIAILVPESFLVADVDTDRAAQLLLDLGWKNSSESVIARTKNGLHVWFWAGGYGGRNRWLGDGQEPNPGRTLLFKGLGGYVVAPPSLHFAPDGTVDGTYEWEFPLVSPGATIFMPDILPEEARARLKRDDLWAADRADNQPTMTTFTQTPVEGVSWWAWPKTWDYQTAGLERAIETAADGNQNNVIHWAAMTAREEGVPYDIAIERLLAAAVKGGHPRDRASATIRGAYKRGK